MQSGAAGGRFARWYELIVVLCAAVVFLGGAISPPSLMDDVDAVQAQIARNMLDSGDWITARLDGVKYFEKPPLKYWTIAISYMVFGVRDWAARLPIALSAILLCWVAFRFGRWAFSPRVGLFAGVALATCAGLFLFTRVLIADVMLTLTVTVALWAFARALDPDEARPRLWSAIMAAALGTGLLLKGLIALVTPGGAVFVYLVVTRQLFSKWAWRRLHPLQAIGIIGLIAAPWHAVATLANPPYLDFTIRSEPGSYRGFFWFYFMNEHVLRFLNLRYPRDYNTVPRLHFWLLHLLWLFPWSVFLPAAARLSYRPADRAGRTRLLALCWTGFLLVFLTFSTTQEYYSMPCYPALALLIGCAMDGGGRWVRFGTKIAGSVAAAAAVAIAAILVIVHGVPAPGDISSALTSNPEVYTLSLGHMRDLTIRSFAYLRVPLALAGIAFVIGAAGAWRLRVPGAFAAMGVMMLMFLHAARLAMVTFDPYLSSRPLAEALKRAPEGGLIVDDQYYFFSSVFFYANRDAFLLNGRVNNLEYGSYAPGAPDVFIDDQKFHKLWNSAARYYLTAARDAAPRLEKLARPAGLHVVADRGGKYLFTNQPIEAAAAGLFETNANLH